MDGQKFEFQTDHHEGGIDESTADLEDAALFDEDEIIWRGAIAK